MATRRTTQDEILQAGIYARISDTKGDEDDLGVARQIKDCAELAAVKGWTVAEIYSEPNVSATRSKVRPEYERMLADIRSGRIKAVLVWDVDRLTRTPRELEDLIDLADEHGLALASVGGEIDLGTAQGRMVARIKGSVGRHETDQLSRRVRRKLLANASNGQVHAPEAYGYRRVVVRDERDRKVRSYDEINETEAAILRQAAKAVLGGQSIRSICAELNANGVPAPRKRKDGSQPRWQSTSLRNMLIRERNVGKRIYQGEVIADAQWEPLWSQDTHDRLVALLTAPERMASANYQGRTRKYLLSGIARCGKCGGLMTVVMPHKTSTAMGYICRDKRDVRRGMLEVDAWVESVMIERLMDPEFQERWTHGDPVKVAALKAERDEAKAQMELAGIEQAHRRITMDQLVMINAVNMPIYEAAVAGLKSLQPRALPTDVAGPDADKKWAKLNLEQKRALIKEYVTITIMPSGGGRRPFDPSLVVVTPNEEPQA